MVGSARYSRNEIFNLYKTQRYISINYLYYFPSYLSSAVENVLIVDLGHLVRGSRLGGMQTIQFVIHATNSETRVSPVPFVAEHTATLLKKR